MVFMHIWFESMSPSPHLTTDNKVSDQKQTDVTASMQRRTECNVDVSCVRTGGKQERSTPTLKRHYRTELRESRLLLLARESFEQSQPWIPAAQKIQKPKDKWCNRYLRWHPTMASKSKPTCFHSQFHVGHHFIWRNWSSCVASQKRFARRWNFQHSTTTAPIGGQIIIETFPSLIHRSIEKIRQLTSKFQFPKSRFYPNTTEALVNVFLTCKLVFRQLSDQFELITQI